MILDSECPPYPYKYQDAGARAKSWIAFLLIPISQAMIDYGLVFIATLGLRALLPYSVNQGMLYAVGVLSFISTMILLSFKIADTNYDMLISLLFPIMKVFPFWLGARNSLNAALEYKGHVMHEHVEQTNQAKLITLYRLHATFL